MEKSWLRQIEGAEPMPLMKCPPCGREVSTDAHACPGCGHPFTTRTPAAPAVIMVNQPKWNRGVAILLSVFFPGVGQMYKGQVFNGAVWLVIVALGYVFFIVPGLILHLCCIVGASLGDPTT